MLNLQIRAIDREIANFVSSTAASEHQEDLCIVAMILSAALAHGHSCLPAAQLNHYAKELGLALSSQWLRRLSSATPPQIGQDKDATQAIIVDNNHLYFQRYFLDEIAVANHLIKRTKSLATDHELAGILERLFVGSSDEQKQAAIVAASSKLAIIVGGPGTGKTTTVVKVLATLCEVKQSMGRMPTIKLIAPTGKAAARMGESIKRGRQGLACSEQVKDAIPATAQTIHRALGWQHDGFKHNQFNPIVADIVLVDEASMVDTRLMLSLLNALPDHAQLILLGDQHQLASVEAGSILNDIYQAAQTPNSALAKNIAILTKSFRFRDDAGIGKLAKYLNTANCDGLHALNIAKDPTIAELKVNSELTISELASPYVDYLQKIHEGASTETIFASFESWRVLCAIRESVSGVTGVNQEIEAYLKQQGLIDNRLIHYAGRPIMVTRNDYQQQLFNGDIGIILPTPSGLMAFFEGADGEFRSLLPARLPSVETAFAMTVHKSQGSEFKHCALVLPTAQYSSASVAKELIYTALTRAKESFLLMSEDSAFISGCEQQTERYSQLARRLINAD